MFPYDPEPFFSNERLGDYWKGYEEPEQTSEASIGEDYKPLQCRRCGAAHDEWEHHCQACGAPVGWWAIYREMGEEERIKLGLGNL